ncbi:hypothetical protein BC833DRAFT_304078 [Globomyces pollinis-pini]|nr:hypothetical protein BC833DRAFT_304078 [Globomyces pollinis-pini]
MKSIYLVSMHLITLYQSLPIVFDFNIYHRPTIQKQIDDDTRRKPFPKVYGWARIGTNLGNVYSSRPVPTSFYCNEITLQPGEYINEVIQLSARALQAGVDFYTTSDCSDGRIAEGQQFRPGPVDSKVVEAGNSILAYEIRIRNELGQIS